ncbi:MAG: hypothetical protein ACOYLB_16800 [Phototrophicaceae bacterium]
MALIEEAIEIKRAITNSIMAKRNVVGLGVGYKNRLGESTGEESVVILVQQKKPKSALTDDDFIPPSVDGVKTDVIEVGILRAQNMQRGRFRPVMQPGVSIAHYMVGAGTFGAVVRDVDTNEKLILSNNHVLANNNGARIGDPILQPGSLDGGISPSDVVAYLERYQQLAYIEDGVPSQPPKTVTPTTPPVPVAPVTPPAPVAPATPTAPSNDSECDVVEAVVILANLIAAMLGSTKRVQSLSLGAQSATLGQPLQAFGASPAEVPMIPAVSLDNKLDAALARPANPAMLSEQILNMGIINGSKAARLGMTVAKSGRTTGYTTGTVTLLNATVNVQYDTVKGTRTARFVNQIICSGMSQAGDSGSLMVDPADRQAVGLLFAGSQYATICTPIEVVLSTLGVTL